MQDEDEDELGQQHSVTSALLLAQQLLQAAQDALPETPQRAQHQCSPLPAAAGLSSRATSCLLAAPFRLLDVPLRRAAGQAGWPRQGWRCSRALATLHLCLLFMRPCLLKGKLCAMVQADGCNHLNLTRAARPLGERLAWQPASFGAWHTRLLQTPLRSGKPVL